ncbi:CAP-Gly domain-containing linker protein 1 isoform X1 [Gambusia affinis]|uniref:CAP-Gly domain-containing linker protein 1 isoform X1 n=1 Tax=Gambusia affinis TaxID=33528 RepID=UPI001CDB88F1|nr:CAP-Gly domain-containing linker protein 1 isoform X1 [Gambusia affinis]XP_043952612.1 CAP-Gly domain-containing linker protein 1 isoform X1 [Gambusia affinis]XP_043952613.1 CAP-Gly domain-containing linker protein 1 isoform X1 [Gambusia affinis]
MDKQGPVTTPGKSSGLKPPSKIARPSTVPTRTSPSSGASKPVPPEKSLSGVTSPTQDVHTDFKIGDRVWVNGSKPGYVQFVGGTQFAPGQWAGIVLDESIGKNDGSVAGVRYFQCEDGRGIFTRSSKLSRTPLPEKEANGGQASPIQAAHATSKTTPAVAAPSAPVTGVKPCGVLNRTVNSTESVSNLSDPDSLKKIRQELRLGDRVLVGGTKAGVVRFLGETDFAKGEWCGVELDEPLGKNDGAVAGTRYFQCLPRYGLFAPVHKVTRIGFPCTTPTKVKNSLRSSTFKRSPSASSISSLSSATSSISGKPSRAGLLTETSVRYARKISSTTALQEALKEKQQHIEQLLAERDLERCEVAKATSRAGEVVQELAMLRKGRDQYGLEMEAKLDQLRSMVEAADRDKVELLNQLEEEKRKVEDLQFRVEEACITKGDLETQTRLEHAHIKELEQSLLFEKTKAEKLQRDLEDTRVATVSERSRIMELEREVADFKLRLRASQQKEDAVSLSQLQVGSLNTQVKCQEKQISELSVDLERKQKELQSALQDRTSLQQQLSSLRCMLAVAEEENRAIAKSMKELEKTVEQSKKDFQTQSREMELKSQLTKTTEKLDRTNVSLVQMTIEKKALESQIDTLKQQNSKYQEELSLTKERSGAENLRIGILCKEIKELKLASQKSQRLDEVPNFSQIPPYRNVDRNGQQPDMKTREPLSTQDKKGDADLQKSTGALISDKDRELETLRNEIAVLRGENAMAKTLQSAVETLEKDKAQLQSRVCTLEKRLMGSQTSDSEGKEAPPSGDPVLQQLREEKEFAEGQINFLNSVIVDLQRKNEELKIKLKKLVLSEFNGNDGTDGFEEAVPKRKKKSAPRLFCDICDCFDLHDTEDCPTQAQSPDSIPHTAYHGNPADERPYCDICEVFGHSTNSCNDDQTF